ncbi:MAG TPA: spore protease YyaC [Verrucomicrobiae bacterium]|nr:spore protease YyaC [Verrucomicrobiae bacterium]
MLVKSVQYDQKNAYIVLSELIMQHLPGQPRDVKILCIGTDRVTGDAFSPLVGTFLKGFGLNPLGTLDEPIHAGNLTQCVEEIGEEPYILALDACLGNLHSVGKINLYEGAITPGAGVGKKLDRVGDLGITMTVNVGGFMENMVLANTRLSLVFSGAQVTALAIYRAMSLTGHVTLQQVSCTK